MRKKISILAILIFVLGLFISTGRASAEEDLSKLLEGPKSSQQIMKDKMADKTRYSAALIVLIGGLVLGLIMGAIVQRSQFCMSNAFTFIRILGTFTKFKSYMVALFISILGVLILSYITIDKKHLVNIMEATRPTYVKFYADDFNLFRFIAGGYIFGMGIVFAGGCASRILVRTGEGNIGSLISVIFFTTGAGLAMTGGFFQSIIQPLGNISKPVVTGITSMMGIKSDTPFAIPNLLGDLVGSKAVSAFSWGILILFGIFLVVWFIRSKERDEFWGAKWPLTGIGIGLLVVIGWAVTGYAKIIAPTPDISDIPHNSLTFANPSYRLVEHLYNSFTTYNYSFNDILTMAQVRENVANAADKQTYIIYNFGVASVVGAILGSTVTALITRTFNFIFPPNFTAYVGHIIGGLLMGFGAVLSLGCNIGQGLSGMSTLGFGALITVIFIILGSWTSVWIRDKFEI